MPFALPDTFLVFLFFVNCSSHHKEGCKVCCKILCSTLTKITRIIKYYKTGKQGGNTQWPGITWQSQENITIFLASCKYVEYLFICPRGKMCFHPYTEIQVRIWLSTCYGVYLHGFADIIKASILYGGKSTDHFLKI